MSDVGLKNYAVYPYQIDLKLSKYLDWFAKEMNCKDAETWEL